MSMVAIFKCTGCKTLRVWGRFRGGEMNPPRAWCITCDHVKILEFVGYRSEQPDDFAANGKWQIGVSA